MRNVQEKSMGALEGLLSELRVVMIPAYWKPTSSLGLDIKKQWISFR